MSVNKSSFPGRSQAYKVVLHTILTYCPALPPSADDPPQESDRYPMVAMTGLRWGSRLNLNWCFYIGPLVFWPSSRLTQTYCCKNRTKLVLQHLNIQHVYYNPTVIVLGVLLNASPQPGGWNPLGLRVQFVD